MIILEITDGLLYYKNQLSSIYKTDERIIREIIKNNTKCIKSNDNLKLIIYYKSNLTFNLLTQNNQSPKLPQLKQTNIIYEYKCQLEDCELQRNSSYIGKTTTTLSRRLTMHLANGGPKQHTLQKHKTQLTR